MPSFISIAAVLALFSTVIASPQFGYENLYNKRHATGLQHTAPIHTGVSTGIVPYPTVGPKYTNHTGPAHAKPAKKAKSSSSSSISYTSTTTLYITEDASDCTSVPSTTTTTLYSTITVIATKASVNVLPVQQSSTTTSTIAVDDEEDCDEYPTSSITATTLSTFTKAVHANHKPSPSPSTTTASTPAAPVKPNGYPSMKWTAGAWNGTVASTGSPHGPSSSAYPTAYATGY